MRAVSSGYGDISEYSEAADSVAVPEISASEVPEPEEVAVVAEVTKRSTKAKATLASMLGALGIGAASILGV